VEWPEFEAELLLQKVLSLPRAKLFSQLQEKVPIHLQAEALRLAEERKRGKPFALLLGTVSFLGLSFRVAEGVFIPRAETETVVRAVLHRQPRGNCLVDVGTGTGCLGLSLAYYGKYRRIYLCDRNEHALRIARDNARALGISNISFVSGDFWTAWRGPKHSLDVLVSNPPYIPSDSLSHLPESVRKYEPSSALDGGKEGLDFLKSLIIASPHWMKKGGLIALEIGDKQFSPVQRFLQEAGFHSLALTKDFRGQDRCVTARMRAL